MSDGRFAKAAEARKYHSLDGLRGVAAIAVVSIHYDGYLKPLILPSAHLAVDMFFLMSGFVIGHAYSEKLSSRMSPMTFIIARLIRLYPMYILGTLIAVLPISAAILLGADLVWTWKTLSLATVAAVTMIPGPPIPNKLPALYVLNFPAWSLFFEVVSNVLYALAFPILRGRAIYLVIAVGGIGIAIASFLYGDVGGGWLWSDAWVGFFRVIFSFF